MLADVERAGAELIVFGGDVAAGPWPCETIDAVRALPNARFVLGNADRPEETFPDPARPLAGYLEARYRDSDRAFLATFAELHVVDGVLYRHGSPRSVDEIITLHTSDDAIREMLEGIEQRTTVIGHTHSQFDRRIDAYRVVNAGSVGNPWERQPGAYWALVDGPDRVELRRTEYDVERAAAALPADYPDPDFAAQLVAPPDPDETAAFFERALGRAS